MAKKIEHVNVDEPVTAERWNRLVDAVNNTITTLEPLVPTVAAMKGVVWDRTFWARLESDSAPYNWTQVRRTKLNNGWEDQPNGMASSTHGSAIAASTTADAGSSSITGDVVRMYPTVGDEGSLQMMFIGGFYIDGVVDFQTISSNDGGGAYSTAGALSLTEVNSVANVPVGTKVLCKLDIATMKWEFEWDSKVSVDGDDAPAYLESQLNDDNEWIEVAKVSVAGNNDIMKVSHVGPDADGSSGALSSLDLFGIALAGGVITYSPLKPRYDSTGHLLGTTVADDTFTYQVKAGDLWLQISANGANGAQIEHLNNTSVVGSIYAPYQIDRSGDTFTWEMYELVIDGAAHVEEWNAVSGQDQSITFAATSPVTVSSTGTVDSYTVTYGFDWVNGINGYCGSANQTLKNSSGTIEWVTD